MKRIYPITRRKEGPSPTTSSQTIETRCVPYYHDNSLSPIGLWQFSGSLEDSSGYGNTLILNAGSTRYTEMIPGFKAALFDSAVEYRLPSGTANFYITGNMTIEMIVSPSDFNQDAYPNHAILVQFAQGTGETQAQNKLYEFGLAGSNHMIWTQEYNTGTNSYFQCNNHALTVGSPAHIAAVRNENSISFFLNGSRVGTTGTVVQTDGGTTSFFRVGGGFGSNTLLASVASLKIFNYALTDAQIMSEFNKTLGAKYTIRSAT